MLTVKTPKPRQYRLNICWDRSITVNTLVEIVSMTPKTVVFLNHQKRQSQWEEISCNWKNMQN